MISVTKLLFMDEYYGDALRYSHNAHRMKSGAAEGMGPVVVWNSTRTCNLRCRHCYMESDGQKYDGELTTEEAKRFIDDLAEFRVPVLLFSGGEPLIRPDFFALAEHAAERGVRPTLSTNGTLITRDVAQRIKDLGVGYVGISLDGLADVKGINRVCFYHLVYSGRGGQMMDEDVTPEESRRAMDTIIARTKDFEARGLKKEILTVDNHCDGGYMYLTALAEGNDAGAEQIKKLIGANGGNRSGIAFGEVDPMGYVHPDQFTQHHTFGNVRERKFGDIWQDVTNPIMAGLKDRKPLLKGRCSQCQYLDWCNGNFRTRAEARTGDFWASDPSCYLTDEEIGVAGAAL